MKTGRNNFRFDFVNKAIVGTKSAIKRANKGNTPEFRELSEMLALHPTFKVAEKNIEHKTNKETHYGLSIERMRNCIELMPDSKSLLREFEAQILVAKTLGAKYPHVKKWFLSRFPNYKNYMEELVKAGKIEPIVRPEEKEDEKNVELAFAM